MIFKTCRSSNVKSTTTKFFSIFSKGYLTIPSWHGYIIIQSDLYKKLSSTALCLDFEQKEYTNIIFNHRRMWGQRFFGSLPHWWYQPTQVTSATSKVDNKKNNNCQLECLLFFCNQRAKTKLQGLNHLRKSVYTVEREIQGFVGEKWFVGFQHAGGIVGNCNHLYNTSRNQNDRLNGNTSPSCDHLPNVMLQLVSQSKSGSAVTWT